MMHRDEDVCIAVMQQPGSSDYLFIFFMKMTHFVEFLQNLWLDLKIGTHKISDPDATDAWSRLTLGVLRSWGSINLMQAVWIGCDQ